MLRETASVVSHDGHVLHLKTERRGTCSGCSLKGGCGQYLLARDNDLLDVPACESTRGLLEGELQSGEQVQIVLSEGQLLNLAWLFYGLPLLGLLLATLFARGLGAGEGMMMLLALGGLALGVYLSRLLLRSKRMRRRVSPQIHRMTAVGVTPNLVRGSST
jgi:sigma-E factor negative regulatory protein RseC